MIYERLFDILHGAWQSSELSMGDSKQKKEFTQYLLTLEDIAIQLQEVCVPDANYARRHMNALRTYPILRSIGMDRPKTIASFEEKYKGIGIYSLLNGSERTIIKPELEKLDSESILEG